MPTLNELLSGKTPEQVRNELYGALRGVGYVKHTGAGTGTLAVTGTAKAASSIRVEVTAGGAVGTAAGRYSVDGGHVWTALSPIPSAPVSLASLGVSLTFSGDFAEGDTYAAETIVPRFAPTAWQPFSVPTTLMDVFAAGLSDLTDLVCAVGRGGLLDFAEGEWLNLLASQVYGIERIPAQAARMSFKVTNASDSLKTFTVGGLVVHDTFGHQYTNSAAASVAASESAFVEFTAVQKGVGPTIVSGDLTLETTIAGVSVSTRDDAEENGIVSAGRDAETDDALRERCRGRWDSLGISLTEAGYAAIIQAAVPSLTRVAASASQNQPGLIQIRAANAAGGATEAEISAAEAAIEDKVPLGMRASVTACESEAVNLTAEVWCSAGYAQAAEAAIREGFAQLLAACPIGGYQVGERRILSREAIAALIMSAPGVVDCDVTAPASDVSLNINSVPAVGAVALTVTAL